MRKIGNQRSSRSEYAEDVYFLERTSLFVLKIATTFLNFRELQRPFPRNFFTTCFDIVFAHLGVIPRARSKFVEIVAAAECYLIITHM